MKTAAPALAPCAVNNRRFKLACPQNGEDPISPTVNGRFALAAISHPVIDTVNLRAVVRTFVTVGVPNMSRCAIMQQNQTSDAQVIAQTSYEIGRAQIAAT